MSQVLNLQTTVNANNQYQNNIDQISQTATATSTAINSLKAINDRIGEIATLADGTKSPAQLQDYATEVGQLIQQAVQLGNTQNQGSYIFGGTISGSPPYSTTTDANGNITAVTYSGNTSMPQVEISTGTTVSAQVPGSNTTGAGPRGLFADSRYGADIFSHMIALKNDLTAGNTAAIASTDAPAIAKDEDNILYQVTANGVVQSQLQTASNQLTQQNLSLNTEVSAKTSADLAQVMTEFTQTQTAYSAALQSGSSILNLSLLNYLH
jgi:flagellar hook-associated protein 3 FlgL